MAQGKRRSTDDYLPNGSIIYWSRRQRLDGRYLIPVKCGKCGNERVVNSSGIHDDFTGLCYPCGQSLRRIVEKDAPETLPNGSVIYWDKEYFNDGMRWVPIRCGGPLCNGSIRNVVVHTTYADNFTGECRRCAHSFHRTGGRAGGRKHNSGGYVEVRITPNHPLFCMAHSQGYVLEHRLVMAEQLGRPLTKDEIVHHINGNKRDNRPENLQLLMRDQYHNGYKSHSDNHHDNIIRRVRIRGRIIKR